MKPAGRLTLDRVRAMALALPDVVEASHMGHPDFRLGGRIFASLQPARGLAVVSLSPEVQRRFLDQHPDVFVPQAGAWGRQGWTGIVIDAADEEAVGEALTEAWQSCRSRGRTSAASTRPRKTAARQAKKPGATASTRPRRSRP